MPGVRARYWNAGHLLGSASIEIEFAERRRSREAAAHSCFRRYRPRRQTAAARSRGAGRLRLRHLGIDLWRQRSPATTPRCAPRSAWPPRSATPQAAKGALLIPAFAVERTQELIVDLVDLMERGEIPAAPIFLDSPLAIRATEVFRKHAASLDPEIDVGRLLELAASAVHRNRR